MSITNSTKPFELHAAYNDVLYVCTSDRYDTATNSESVTAVANNGSGKCRYTVASHNFKVNDVLTGSGFDPEDTYNVRQTVTAVTSTTIDTNVTFSATDTGTLTRTNDNFKIIADIKESGTTLVSLEAAADSSGNFNFNFSGALANEIEKKGGHDVIAYDGSDGIISSASINSGINYTITFTEWYDDKDGILTSRDTLNVTTINSKSIYAYNIALLENGFSTDTFSDYIMSGSSKKFLTKGNLKKKDGEEVFVSFITQESSAKFKFTQYDAAGTPTASTDTATTINNNRGVCVINDTTLPSNKVRVDIQILNTSDVAISETLSIYRDSVCTKNEVRVEFMNRLGGIDSYSFRDAEIRISNTPNNIRLEDVYNTLSVSPSKTIKLTGSIETAENMAWLEELYTSRVVYLTDNSTRLRMAVVRNRAITQTREPYVPEIDLQMSDPKLN